PPEADSNEGWIWGTGLQATVAATRRVMMAFTSSLMTPARHRLLFLWIEARGAWLMVRMGRIRAA
ncbi:unnamed protein product, partial [Urochloa humidicola]